MLATLVRINAQFVLSPGETCGNRIKKRVITLKPWTKIHSVVAHGLRLNIAQPRNTNRAAGARSRNGLVDSSKSGGSKKAGMNWKTATTVTLVGRDRSISGSPLAHWIG
jgi:hypothetical protein